MDATTEATFDDLDNLSLPFNGTGNITDQIEDGPSDNDLTHYILLAVVQMGVISGNLLIILIICLNRKLWTATNMFLLSLAIGDMMIGAIVIPINYAVPTALFYGYTTCIYSASFTVIISLATISNIFAVSFDRYIAITRPLRYKILMTPTKAMLILVVSWVYAIVLGLFPLMGWRVETSTCRRGETYDPYYVILIFVSGVVLPITGSGIMYAKIIYIAWNMKKKARRLQAQYAAPAPSMVHVNPAFQASNPDLENATGQATENLELQAQQINRSDSRTRSMQTTTEIGSQEEIRQPRQIKKVDRSNLITFAILTIYFEISWLPVFVSMMIDAFVSPLVLPWWSHSLFGVIAFTNSAIDPVIYGYGKRDIRLAIVDTCKKICRCK